MPSQMTMNWAKFWRKACAVHRHNAIRWSGRARSAEHMLELVTKERDWAWQQLEHMHRGVNRAFDILGDLPASDWDGDGDAD